MKMAKDPPTVLYDAARCGINTHDAFHSNAFLYLFFLFPEHFNPLFKM